MKRPVERGQMIRGSKPKRGHCATCDPTPKGRVSAGDLWARAMAAPPGWRVRIESGHPPVE